MAACQQWELAFAQDWLKVWFAFEVHAMFDYSRWMCPITKYWKESYDSRWLGYILLEVGIVSWPWYVFTFGLVWLSSAKAKHCIFFKPRSFIHFGIYRNGYYGFSFCWIRLLVREVYHLDGIMHKWANRHFDEFEKTSRCNMEYRIKRINTN